MLLGAQGPGLQKDGIGDADLADVYDALTSDRVYRLALDPVDALAHMRAGRGKHFDPDLLDLFIDTIDEVRAAEPDPAS